MYKSRYLKKVFHAHYHTYKPPKMKSIDVRARQQQIYLCMCV